MHLEKNNMGLFPNEAARALRFLDPMAVVGLEFGEQWPVEAFLEPFNGQSASLCQWQLLH